MIARLFIFILMIAINLLKNFFISLNMAEKNKLVDSGIFTTLEIHLDKSQKSKKLAK